MCSVHKQCLLGRTLDTLDSVTVSQQYGHQASYIKHQTQTYKYGEPIIYSLTNNSLDPF